MDPQDYLGVIWRRRWLVLLMAGIGAAAVLLVGQPPPPAASYSSTLTLAVTEEEAPETVGLYAYVASETTQISQQVADDLGEGVYDDLPTRDALELSVFISADPDIGTLTLLADGQPSEEIAGTVVGSYGQYIIDYARSRRGTDQDGQLQALDERQANLEEEIAELSDELDDLADNLTPEELDRLDGAPVDPAIQAQLDVAVESLRVVLAEADELRSQSVDELTPIMAIGEPEVIEQADIDPLGLGGRMAIGVAVALLLGVGLAVTLHRFDSRIFSRRDAEAAFRMPVLAEVPGFGRRARRSREIITQTQPSSPSSEAFRLLRSALALARSRQLDKLDDPAAGHTGTVVLVASAAAETGRSTTVANLAVAAVDAGNAVLVISADLRWPTVHELLGVSPGIGLADALDDQQASEGEIELNRYLVPTNAVGVTLLPHGRTVSNPGERLADTGPLIKAAREQFDLILIDTPPMLAGNDVNELFSFVDLVLLVARTGRTTIDEGHWTDEIAERLHAPVCGVALIGARSDLERRGALRRSFRRRLSRKARRVQALTPPRTTPSGQTAAPVAHHGAPAAAPQQWPDTGWRPPGVAGGPESPATQPQEPVAQESWAQRSVPNPATDWAAATAEHPALRVERLNQPPGEPGSDGPVFLGPSPSHRQAGEQKHVPDISDIFFNQQQAAAAAAAAASGQAPADGNNDNDNGTTSGGDGFEVQPRDHAVTNHRADAQHANGQAAGGET